MLIIIKHIELSSYESAWSLPLHPSTNIRRLHRLNVWLCSFLCVCIYIYTTFMLNTKQGFFVLRLRYDNSLVCRRMLRRYFSHIWTVWFVPPFSLLDFFAFYPLALFCMSLIHTLLQRAPASFLGWLCLRLLAYWRYIFFSLVLFNIHIYIYISLLRLTK